MSITVRSITKQYDGKKTPVLQNFKMTFENGKIYAILGKSGSGKSTLLNTIAGVIPCDADLDKDQISYVFQNDALIENISVKNNVKLVINEKDKVKKDKTAIKFLELLEIQSHAEKFPDSLSGGERQRVSIARALAHNYDTLLMDEPFNSLDYGVKKRIMRLVCELNKQAEKTVIIATHDIDEALAVADEIYLLHDFPAKLTILAEIAEKQEQRDIYDERFSKLKKEIISKLEEI